jgi:hypothetical protein
MRGAISESGGNSSLAEECGVSGNRKRGQANRIEAAKAKAQPKATGRLKPLRLFSTPQLWFLGGQGVYQVDDHKMESEGFEEKYRAVVNEATQRRTGQPMVGKVEPGGEGVLIHPPYTKVFADSTVRKNNARPLEDWQSFRVAPE